MKFYWVTTSLIKRTHVITNTQTFYLHSLSHFQMIVRLVMFSLVFCSSMRTAHTKHTKLNSYGLIGDTDLVYRRNITHISTDLSKSTVRTVITANFFISTHRPCICIRQWSIQMYLYFDIIDQFSDICNNIEMVII